MFNKYSFPCLPLGVEPAGAEGPVVSGTGQTKIPYNCHKHKK